jgi:predicted nucleic acid-binding protein
MPLLQLPAAEFDLPRKLALLDTNVLVALADPRENLHADANYVIEEIRYTWLVMPPVIVEACGLLIRRRRIQETWALAEWLLDPGNAILLPDLHDVRKTAESFEAHTRWMRRYGVDYVDAYLVELALHNLQVRVTMTR